MATTPSATSPNSEIEIQALLTTVETPTITAPPTVNNNNPSAEDPLNKASSENEPMESKPCNNSSPRRVTPTSSASHSSSHSRRGRTESGVIRTARGTSRSPRTNPYPDPITIGNTTNRARRLVYARRWGWLSTTLDTWRNVEGIRISAEPMDISPYTQEPMHHTVPVLAARLSRHEDRLDDIQMEQYRHEERLDAMEQEQRETRHNWMHLAQGRVAQIYQNQEDITETMGIVHNQVIGNRNEISVLQTRLEQCETRLRETEETLRMVGRLTETMERVVTLLPPPNPR